MEPLKPPHKTPYVLAAIGLIVIIVLAVYAVAFLFIPFSSWSFGQTLQDSSANINALNLNFTADVGQINVITQKIQNSNILIHVSANGIRGSLENNSGEAPVFVFFRNITDEDILTVYCQVSVKNPYSFESSVVYDIFVDPALLLNLTVSSSTGQISFTADKATTIKALNLNADVGKVQANLEKNVIFAGDISIKTNTGQVYYRMSETSVGGNSTIILQSNIGSVNMDIFQTKTLQGNFQVNAATDTGSINIALKIDGGVGAKITSQTAGLSNINFEVNNFSGNKSTIQSNNYPTSSNVEINNTISGLGSINIDASYLTKLNSA